MEIHPVFMHQKIYCEDGITPQTDLHIQCSLNRILGNIFVESYMPGVKFILDSKRPWIGQNNLENKLEDSDFAISKLTIKQR